MRVLDEQGRMVSEILEVDTARRIDASHYLVPAGMARVDMDRQLDQAVRQGGQGPAGETVPSNIPRASNVDRPSPHRVLRRMVVRMRGDEAIHLTTKSASATSQDGSESVHVNGMRAIDGVWYAQIAGATSNDATAIPRPAAAVYMVLSGRFDQLP